MKPVKMAANNNSTLSLRSVLEKDKLKEDGSNFLDWFRNLRIVLKQERKLYVIDGPVPEEPHADATRAVKDKHKRHVDDSIDIGCLMLATMCPAIQKDLEHLEAYDLTVHLKESFLQQARQERYDTTKALHSCKMAEGASVSAHVLKMRSHIDHLERLGFPVSLELATDLILNSLPDSYGSFVMNYNMNGMEKSLSELHSMLKTAEINIKKKPSHVLNVNKGKGMKKEGKGKGKTKPKPKVGNKTAPKPQNPPKPNAHKDAVCYHCNETGHWKRNCKLYLEELKKKGSETTTSGAEKQ